jgi:regulatory protein
LNNFTMESLTPCNPTILKIALKYISFRPRSVYELIQYLNTKDFSKPEIRQAVQYLTHYNYLDDTAFARLFIETRTRSKIKSKYAIQYELKKKGIAEEIFEKLLLDYNDKDLAIKAVESKIKIWQSYSDDTFKKKMMSFLSYRGFGFDTCQTVCNHYMNKRQPGR